MATQHPDNAGPAYWDKYHHDGFVSALAEAKECVVCFGDLNVNEYMWDWEGKHADAAVVDKLLSEHIDFFRKSQLGRDIFLTFRIPNIWTEKGYSLIQAMSAILLAEDFARDLNFKQRPLFEVILPMTERAEQLLKMQVMFQQLARFKAKNFSHTSQDNTDQLELIPLLEGVENQLGVYKLLKRYLEIYQKQFKRRPKYLRVFLARSDPAMASGMLATVLANKLALSQIAVFENKHSLPIHPIAGVGSLPFRGGLSPLTAADYANNNPGFRTVTVQSAFRYDYGRRQVEQAIKQLQKTLPKSKPKIINEIDAARVETIIKDSTELYQATLGSIARDLKPVFAAFPRRRERRLHIGLLAYQRSVGDQSLPRAITFTGSFYSIGVPPEFIGLGRSLAKLSQSELKLLLKIYPSLSQEIERAGRFLSKENLGYLQRRNRAWRAVAKDIAATESILGLRFGPRTYDEKAHKNLSANVLITNNQKSLTGLIEELAKLRKSLG